MPYPLGFFAHCSSMEVEADLIIAPMLAVLDGKLNLRYVRPPIRLASRIKNPTTVAILAFRKCLGFEIIITAERINGIAIENVYTAGKNLPIAWACIQQT